MVITVHVRIPGQTGWQAAIRCTKRRERGSEYHNLSLPSLHQSGLDDNPEQRAESDARAGHGETDSTCSFNAGGR
jgi:hypothetical protein